MKSRTGPSVTFDEAPADLEGLSFDIELAFLDVRGVTGATRAALRALPETIPDFTSATARNHFARGIWRPVSGVEKPRHSGLDVFGLTFISYLGSQYGMPAGMARTVPLSLVKFMRSGQMTPDQIGDPEYKAWCSFFVRYKDDGTPAVFLAQPYAASDLDVAGLCEQAGVSSVITINWKRLLAAAVLATNERWELITNTKG